MATHPIRKAWRIRVGKVIRATRVARGVTLTRVAAQLRWSSAKLSRIENGEQACTLDDLNALARILDCPPDSLITGEGA